MFKVSVVRTTNFKIVWVKTIRGLLGAWNVSSEFFFFFEGGDRNILAWTSFRVETINILKTIKIVPDKT